MIHNNVRRLTFENIHFYMDSTDMGETIWITLELT